MRTEDEIIKDFREKYYEEFGVEITYDEAQEQLARLVRFLGVVFYPDIDEIDQNP